MIWFCCRFCEVVLLSHRICPRSLEGWLVLWLPVSQWQQPSPVTPDSTPTPQPICYLWDAPSFPAWRLFPWSGATGALKLFWATVIVSSSGYRLSDFLRVPVTEGGRLPAGLRGFRRNPGQYGQQKADIHLGPSLSPTLKPGGKAAPNCYPGKLKANNLFSYANIYMRQRAPSTYFRFTDSLTLFPFSCSRNLVLRTQSSFLLMVTTIGYWLRSGFAALTSSAISWPPIFWGLIWWLSCAAGPPCGTSHRRIHCTRFTILDYPFLHFNSPLSLQIIISFSDSCWCHM